MATAATWTNEITGTIIFFFALTMGTVLLVRHRDSKAKILMYFGFTCISVGLIYIIFPIRMLSIFVPLTNIIFWQSPLTGSYVFVGLSTYSWIGSTVLISTYMGTELLLPRKLNLDTLQQKYDELKSKKKEGFNQALTKIALLLKIQRPRLWFYIPAWILCIVWEFFLFVGPPRWLNIQEEMGLVGDTSFKLGSPPFFLMMFFALYLLLFLGLGFLLRAIRTGGVLEEKFVILSVGIFLMIMELIFEGISAIGDSVEIMILLRTLMILGLTLLNYGLKPSKKKRKNLKLPRVVADLAYYVIGETEELDDQFWDRYITKSKEMIEEYKEEKKKGSGE